MRFRTVLFVVLLGTLVFGQDILNLWKDGDYETRGVPGGRSGNCGVLKSDAKVHWKSLDERKIAVKPFATYELSAYVKGEKGNAIALYTYNYNCYGWFNAGTPMPVVKEMKEWTLVSRGIISIQDTIAVMPLAFLDGGPGEAYVDDMSMTEVASPEETIKQLEAKQDKTTYDRQILMRWHLLHDDVQSAKAAIDTNNMREMAEYHCLMAKRANLESEKLEHVTGMLAAGCYDFPDAHLRMAELMKGVSVDAWLDACIKGLMAYKGKNAKHLKCLVGDMNVSDGTWAETTARLETLQKNRDIIKAFATEQSKQPGRAWLAKASDNVDAAIQVIQKKLTDYGNCQISLAGKPLEAWVIVKPIEATPSEAKACTELQIRLERQTRVLLPIVEGDATNGKLPIYIGRVPETKRAAWPIDYAKLRFDGIHVELRPDGLVLGGGQRGVLYAVYDYLEEQLGWRWFADDCIVFPKQGSIKVAPMKKTHRPPI